MSEFANQYPKLFAVARWLLVVGTTAIAIVLLGVAIRPTLDPSYGWTPIRFYIDGKEFRGGFRKCKQPCPNRLDEDYP